jgi:hypothetical protein
MENAPWCIRALVLRRPQVILDNQRHKSVADH